MSVIGSRRLLLLGLVFLAFAAIGLLPGDAEALTVHPGDVRIIADVVWADDTHEVHGNLTVVGGIELVLLRADLVIVGTGNGSHRLETELGGSIKAYDSTIRGSPHTIGVVIRGISVFEDCLLENLWAGEGSPGMLVADPVVMSNTTVRGSPNGTGVLVTAAVDAMGSTFDGLGTTQLVISDPEAPLVSSVVDCTFKRGAIPVAGSVGLSVQWSSSLQVSTSLEVVDCYFEGFSQGLSATVNSTLPKLNVTGSWFDFCSEGLVVMGRGATVHVEGCRASTATSAGFTFYDVDPMGPHLELTTVGLNCTGSAIGIYVLGPVLGFSPLLSRVHVTDCTHGIQALGSTVRVEDSVVLNNQVCFYVENKARIEVRRTEHDHRSAAIEPRQQAAVVAFTTIDIASCRWGGAQAITEGQLFLMGDDGVELDRLDLTALGPREVVAWSLTRFNDLGRLWIVPTVMQGGVPFVGANISIYNTSKQHVEVIDHLPPELGGLWPEDGHWFNVSRPWASGSAHDLGSGLDRVAVRLLDGQELDAAWDAGGNWTVTFDPVPDGTVVLEVEAWDRSGGNTTFTVGQLHLDTQDPTIVLEDRYLELANGTLLVPANDIMIVGQTEAHCTVRGWEPGVPPDHPFKCNETVLADAEGRFTIQLCPGRGYHDLLLRSIDRAGNSVVTSIKVAMDAYPPRVAILVPADPKTPPWEIWLNTTTVVVSGRVTDEGPSQWFSAWVNDQEVELSEGDFSVEVELPEGERLITLRALDQAGHEATTTVTVHIDVTPPILTITSPQESRFFTLDLKVDLQGEVFDANLANLTLDGEPLSTVGDVFTGVLDILEGENRFLVSAWDKAGNPVTRVITILRDVTPPEYSFTARLLDGIEVEVGGTRYARYTGDGEPTVEFVFSLSEWAQVKASGGLGLVEGEDEVTMLARVFEGENTISFTVTDEAGNVATSTTYRITLDMTPPGIGLQGGDDNITTRDRNYRILGRVEKGSTLTLNSERVKVNSDGTFSLEVDLRVGENIFELVAVDLVGLSTSRNVTITREREADDGPAPGAAAVVTGLLLVAGLSGASRSRARRG